MARGIARIMKAFPKFRPEQVEVLRDRWKANGFTDERIMDAVNDVIDNYDGWSLPNLANFIQYDRSYLTYNEVLKLVADGDLMSHYKVVDREKGLWKKL